MATLRIPLGELNEVLVDESDRGAVLIAAELVDQSLERLLLSYAPSKLSAKLRKKALGMGGPWGSLSSKTLTAYLSDHIDLQILNAIDELRSIRNTAAHSSADFRLADYASQIEKITDQWRGLAKGVKDAVRFRLMSVVIEAAERHSLKIGSKKVDVSALNSLSDVMNFMRKNPEFVEATGAPVGRLEFCTLVAFICKTIESNCKA